MIKKEKAKRTVIAPQAGKQELAFNVKADVIIYGGAAGSGKSRLMLMKPLPYINDPNFHCVFFRRQTTQLKGAGGLWGDSKSLYEPFKPKIQESQLRMTFPSGATCSYNHLEHELDCVKHQGLQYSAIFMDELTHYSKYQVTYLMSRLRSEAEVDSFFMGTCNPDADSWLLSWIDWWLDDEGFPDPDKCGKIRYFITVGDDLVFRDTKEELLNNPDFDHYTKVWNPNTQEYITIEPKSMCFIGGTIFDNPYLIAQNPRYLAELKSLPRVERERLLDGNWYARAEGSSYFKREWLTQLDSRPIQAFEARAWDKAGTEPSEKNRYPDYTASAKMLKDKNGMFILVGEDNRDCKDPDSPILGQFRKRVGERDNLIERQAKQDGTDCRVVFAVDPAQAGKVEYRESAKKLTNEGFIVRPDPMPNNKSKLTRFAPFASACENGLVAIVESTFDKETLEALYKELESFDGEPSTSTKHDDKADAVASVFNFLSKERYVPTFDMVDTSCSNPMDFNQLMI